MITAALALLAAGPTTWVPVGVSGSRLRVFLDQNSLRTADGLVEAVVRIGSPRSIADNIVIVYQHEQFDCAGRRWRLTGYEGVDAEGHVVARQTAKPLPMLIPITSGSMGEETLETACFLAKQDKAGG